MSWRFTVTPTDLSDTGGRYNRRQSGQDRHKLELECHKQSTSSQVVPVPTLSRSMQSGKDKRKLERNFSILM